MSKEIPSFSSSQSFKKNRVDFNLFGSLFLQVEVKGADEQQAHLSKKRVETEMGLNRYGRKS